MLTKQQAIELSEKTRLDLVDSVNRNTRPRSTAAAAFTKSRAEDIKAGCLHGIDSLMRALMSAGAFADVPSPTPEAP